MPRSVLVLSSEPDLFGAAKRVVAKDPRFLVAGDSLHCDGTGAPLTNIYPVEPVLPEWDGHGVIGRVECRCRVEIGDC